jgi:hypothetical protein
MFPTADAVNEALRFLLRVVRDNKTLASTVQANMERLGIAKAAFFLRETASQPLNYLEIKDQLFGEMKATDIYAQIKGGYD